MYTFIKIVIILCFISTLESVCWANPHTIPVDYATSNLMSSSYNVFLSENKNDAYACQTYDLFVGDTIDIHAWGYSFYYPITVYNSHASTGSCPPGISLFLSNYVYNTTYDDHAFSASYTGKVENSRGYYNNTVTLSGTAYPDTDFEQSFVIIEERCFHIDDYPDVPSDTNHIQTLPVHLNWDTSTQWVDGHLNKYNKSDKDVFRLDVDRGIYCVETSSAKNPLAIKVYKKQRFSYAYDGDPIAKTNQFNIYDEDGTIDDTHQRVYFELDNNNGAYIQISLSSYSADEQESYKVRVSHVRPVILVHGIQCYPRIVDDIKDGYNSMGHWNDYLPWDYTMHPCKCYNLVWDSDTDELFHNGGAIDKINEKIQEAYDECDKDVVLIGHSMGGYFVRFGLKSSKKDKIYKAVTLGTPHYGSETANYAIEGLFGIHISAWYKETHENNLIALARGSEFVWHMHDWGGVNKLLCIAGKGAPKRLPLGYTFGLTVSDGVVPLSSGLVEGASDNIIIPNADHGTIGLATYVPQNIYPYDSSPGLGFWNRITNKNENDRRLPASFIMGHQYGKRIYEPVRDFIK